MYLKQFSFNPLGVNCFVLWDDTLEGVIIDPSCYFPSEQEEISAFITSNNIKVKMLLNTHLHFDHCLGHRHCASLTGAKLYANRADAPLYENFELQCKRFGFMTFDKTVQLFHGVNDGDVLRFGTTGLLALHVPGHSPGSICYYHEPSGQLFSGDVLFSGSIGRTDLQGGNFELLVTGIREKLLSLPEATIVYPGHGEATTVGDEKRENMYLR